MICNLSNGMLTDEDGRTGYIADDHSLEFNFQPLAGFIYDAGFYICVNGSLGFGRSALWNSCDRGGSFNLYSSEVVSNCSLVYLQTLFGT